MTDDTDDIESKIDTEYWWIARHFPGYVLSCGAA